MVLDPNQSGAEVALLAEFKLSLNNYLTELVTSPVRSLAEIIAFNQNNPELVCPFFNPVLLTWLLSFSYRSFLLQAISLSLKLWIYIVYTDCNLTDYNKLLSYFTIWLLQIQIQERSKSFSQEVFIAAEATKGIGEKERKAMAMMEKLSEDGFEKLMIENELDALVTLGSGVSTVLAIGGYPAIIVPAGYNSTNGMPFGICFGGVKGSEPKLIEIAYAFEQATMICRPPFSKSINTLIPSF